MSPRHEARPDPAGARTVRLRGGPFAGSVAQLRPLARRVHFLAGILVAPFLLLLCLTGLVYAVSPQIHEDLYASQLFVPEVRGAPRPVGEQVAAALAAHPEGQLRAVVPPPAPDRTTRVDLAVPNLTRPGEARSVFVDPYTNFISGELTTVDGRMPANVWLRQLHADLHLGELGRLYSEVAASWVPALVVGGLVLWVAKQGRRRRSVRELLTPWPRGKGEQARMRAVHGPLGVWLTVGLLVLSGTGLTMSRFAGWGLPQVRAPELVAAPVEVPFGVRPVGVDRVLQLARAEGLTGELRVSAPTAPDRPYTVAEVSPGLPIRKDAITVDPYTAQVTERIGWEDYPFLARVVELGVQAHTGTLFGVANQVVLVLIVIATIVVILLGYRMWWRRNPYGEARLPEAPPPALRGLTPAIGVPVVLVTVVLAWLMPAFGLGLVAFVVVDLLIGALRRRQERLRRTVGAGALLVAASALGVAAVATTSPPAGRVDVVAAPPAVAAPAPVPAPPSPEVTSEEADGTGGPAEPPAAGAPRRPPGGGPAPGLAAGVRPAPGTPRPAPRTPRPAPGDDGPRPAASAPRPSTAPAAPEDEAEDRTDDRRDPGDRADRPRPDDADDDAARATDGPRPSPSPPTPPSAPPAAAAPAPQPPQQSPDRPEEQPGLVGRLVGALVDTVEGVTGRLLGG